MPEFCLPQFGKVQNPKMKNVVPHFPESAENRKEWKAIKKKKYSSTIVTQNHIREIKNPIRLPTQSEIQDLQCVKRAIKLLTW